MVGELDGFLYAFECMCERFSLSGHIIQLLKGDCGGQGGSVSANGKLYKAKQVMIFVFGYKKGFAILFNHTSIVKTIGRSQH